MESAATNRHSVRQPEVPTLGDLLRRLRDARGVSRERLAFTAGVSASYVTHLEKGERARPTREVVTALVRCLERMAPLTIADRRQLADLAGLEADRLPTVAELCAALTPDMLRALRMYQPYPAAYLDVRVNVLACNDSWEDAFPGARADGNMLRWFFGNPLATSVSVNWDSDVRVAVSWLRGSIGTSGNPEGFAELLSDLGELPGFRKVWYEGDVGFAPHLWELHLRNPVTGVVRGIYLQMGHLDAAAYPRQLFAVIGLPFSAAGQE